MSPLSPRQAVLVGYRRSPFDFAHKGKLAKIRPDDLASAVLSNLLADLNSPVGDISDVILGCAFPEAEQGLNMARLVGLMSGLPHQVPGATINRYCGSSMQAIHWACGQIALGAGDIFVAGGVESMSRIPIMGFNPMPHPGFLTENPDAFTSMGMTAEHIARQYDISRSDQEDYAVHSHKLAAAAQTAGHFKAEIAEIDHGEQRIQADGCIRADTHPGLLQSLQPAFDVNGTVTAGTSSPLTDGASMVLVASYDYACRHDLPILAIVKSVAVTGCDPKIMGIGPVSASQLALSRAGLDLADIDIIEINEAFAAQLLACQRILKIDIDRLNLEGGALALGHPLGASGARLVGKAALLLQNHQKQFALASQCIGGGQGIATILEALP